MMTDRYILNGHNAVLCEDLMTWVAFMQSGDRRVAREKIGESDVSTVFLGVDHNWHDHGPPTLFETMVFGGPRDGEQNRCSTWDEAEVMHKAMCERVSRPSCKCGEMGFETHTCPFQVDVHDNSDFQCNCCEECIQNCRDDI